MKAIIEQTLKKLFTRIKNLKPVAHYDTIEEARFQNTDRNLNISVVSLEIRMFTQGDGVFRLGMSAQSTSGLSEYEVGLMHGSLDEVRAKLLDENTALQIIEHMKKASDRFQMGDFA